MLGTVAVNVPLISIRAPARGATSAVVPHRITAVISIRAPARGATKLCIHHLFLHQFQSALPRGERHHSRYSYPQDNADFNPRSREGSDALITAYKALTGDFNPRSREGSDVV